MSDLRRGKEFVFLNQTLILDPLKALYWREHKMLVISDLHLGKAAHFRKSGIPIPTSIHSHDLHNLDYLVAYYHPVTIIFLGDLFHSEINNEWDDFIFWLNQNSQLDIILVKGNHDILNESIYDLSILQLKDELIVKPFHFTHEAVQSDYYNVSGHVHPSIRLLGSARQAMTLSCFYFSLTSAILPAFGNFTGNFKIKPEKNSKIFAVAEDEIIALMG
jgi:DNA ligase-associated metallophosphoesterase